jgi:hypothetical protein
VLAAIDELEARSGGEVPNDTRDEYFVGAGGRADPGSDVNVDPGNCVAAQFNLTDVHACPYWEIERGELASNLQRTVESECGTVEDGRDAIAGVSDLSAIGASDRFAHKAVVVVEQGVPRLVTQSFRCPRGADQVGEEQRRKDAVCPRRRSYSGEKLFEVVVPRWHVGLER